MSVSKMQVDALEEWLRPRLGALINHGEKVRALLESANGPQEIIRSAIQVVMDSEVCPPGQTSESTGDSKPPLTAQQMSIWHALLPILAEHGLLAVRGSGPTLGLEDCPLNKEQAAEYLGFSVSKLNRCMQKRQIAYEKFGTGRTATVRFQRSELDRFRQSRKVSARQRELLTTPRLEK